MRSGCSYRPFRGWDEARAVSRVERLARVSSEQHADGCDRHAAHAPHRRLHSSSSLSRVLRRRPGVRRRRRPHLPTLSVRAALSISLRSVSGIWRMMEVSEESGKQG